MNYEISHYNLVKKNILGCLFIIASFISTTTFSAEHASYDSLIKSYNSAKDKESYKNKIWSEFGQEKTVFISDLSGFTTTTEKKGIVHFLGLIDINHEISGQIIKKNKGDIVKFEADNVYAVFNKPEDAIKSAIEIEQYFSKYNTGKAKEDSIKVSIGISEGKILVLPHDLYGNAVNLSSKLGEDTAKAGQILVDNAIFKDKSLDKTYHSNILSIDQSGAKIYYRSIHWDNAK